VAILKLWEIGTISIFAGFVIFGFRLRNIIVPMEKLQLYYNCSYYKAAAATTTASTTGATAAAVTLITAATFTVATITAPTRTATITTAATTAVATKTAATTTTATMTAAGITADTITALLTVHYNGGCTLDLSPSCKTGVGSHTFVHLSVTA